MGWHIEKSKEICKKCNNNLTQTSLKSMWIDDHETSCETCHPGQAEQLLSYRDNREAKADCWRDRNDEPDEEDDDNDDLMVDEEEE